MGRVLYLGPSWHGPSFVSWAELAWAEFYVGRVGMGRVGFGPSCPAPLDCQLSMYILLTDFKLYIYFGPLTTDTPRACQCRRTNYVLKKNPVLYPGRRRRRVAKEKKKSCIDIHGHTLLLLPFIGPGAFKNVLVQRDMRMTGKNNVPLGLAWCTGWSGLKDPA